MRRHWTLSITALCANRAVRAMVWTIYYLAILLGLLLLYGRGDFSTPHVIYQEF